MSPILIIAGVSGSGKTTLGLALSQKTGIPFFDGDDFHPKSNVSKMSKGVPLTDVDRKGWLDRLNRLAQEEQHKKGAIIACSALKQTYRKTLSRDITHMCWAFLIGDMATLTKRMDNRAGHFMPASLLQSQLETWEPPQYGLSLDINQPASEQLDKILAYYNLV